MENFIGHRIKELRNSYDLGLKDFANYCGLSHVAIFHLENARTSKPHRSSIQRIANNFGTTSNWLIYGEDKMLPNGKLDLGQLDTVENTKWKTEAFEELKNTNRLLEKEIDRLWQVIQNIQPQSLVSQK